MEIRYSPYNSPFVPSRSAGIYWIGREYQDQPHNAHVWVYRHHLAKVELGLNRSDQQIHTDSVAIAAKALHRPFLSCCGCPWCQAAAQKMSGAKVAVPVTPPLCPMGGTFRGETGC